MTVYAFPSIIPNDSSIEYKSNTSVFRSPFNGAIQTLDRGGEGWMYRMNFRNLTNAQRTELTAFLVRLNGQQHRFTAYNHAESNRGVFGGSPQISGSGQTGRTVNISNASINITNWIRAGDWFGIGGELKMCVLDADSDGTGLVTIEFMPRIRVSPANLSAVTTSAATGQFMLGRDGAKWTNRPGGFSDLSIDSLEDIVA